MAEFARGRFFEAHEEWEHLWMLARGEDRLYLQGLIQIAAACVHSERSRTGPARRLAALARAKLEGLRPGSRRIDVAALIELATHLESSGSPEAVQELVSFFLRAAAGGRAPSKSPAGQSSSAARLTAAITSESG